MILLPRLFLSHPSSVCVCANSQEYLPTYALVRGSKMSGVVPPSSFKKIFISYYVYEYFAHMLVVCVLYTCLVPTRVRSSGSGVKGGCKLPNEYWELNPGFYRSSKCSEPLSHLSSSLLVVY